LLCTSLYSQTKRTPTDAEYIKLVQELKIAREEKNAARLADIYFDLAFYEEEIKKNSEVAFDYFVRAKQYYDRDNNIAQANKINRIIAKRYAKSGFRNEAIAIYESLIKYYMSINDNNSLAYIYLDLSEVYRDRGDTDRSLQALNKSIELNKLIRDTVLLINLNFQKIDNYLKINETDSALITAAKNAKIASMINDVERVAKSLYYIASVNLLKANQDNAIKYFYESLNMKKNTPYDEERRSIYLGLSSAYKAKNQFKEAYEFALKYNSLNDSILNHDRIKSINDLTIKHQADEKEKDIRFLEIENKSVLQKILLTRSALYFVAIGFFALLIALYFVIRFYTQKIRIEKIINEQQHEIDMQKIRELEDKISITNMQSMIVGQEKERSRIAGDLHDSLGGLLSAVKLQFDNVKKHLNGHLNLKEYHKATDLLDVAVEELRNISRNLQPGALKDLGLISAIKDLVNRFEEKNYPEIYFQYYNIDDKLDDMVTLNIYRIIQELINNSIKHALAKEILIQIVKEGEEIILEYEDDGKGFDPNKISKKGMGLENINSRVNFLKGSLTMQSSENKGVSYVIRIPIYKKESVES
jgi:signal transduction histidine kinase